MTRRQRRLRERLALGRSTKAGSAALAERASERRILAEQRRRLLARWAR